jgi:heme/copper-type cytochrome/quinol oxidase subunit 1
MHLLRHPRNAALVGIVFLVIAVIYWIVPTIAGLTVPYDLVAAGTTMLLFLGVAMALMAYVLVAGTRGE